MGCDHAPDHMRCHHCPAGHSGAMRVALAFQRTMWSGTLPTAWNSGRMYLVASARAPVLCKGFHSLGFHGAKRRVEARARGVMHSCKPIDVAVAARVGDALEPPFAEAKINFMRSTSLLWSSASCTSSRFTHRNRTSNPPRAAALRIAISLSVSSSRPDSASATWLPPLAGWRRCS